MLEWLKIDCKVEGDFRPPFFTGSMIRGTIGNALKRVVCINPDYQCSGCFASHECVYHRFYELQNTSHQFRLGITLQPKRMDFSLFLFEASAKALPYFLSAIKKGFEEFGIGRDRVTMKIASMECNEISVYDGSAFGSLLAVTPKQFEIDSFCQDLTLDFTMPLRIKQNNRLARHEVDLHALIVSIHNRYREIKGLERQKLNCEIRGDIVASDMKFVEMQRFSNRQKRRMNMGGLKGTMKISGLDKQSYRYLKIGEIIGAGKQTSFGLGSYQMKGES